MFKHQGSTCHLYIFIGESQICVLGLDNSLHILFSYHNSIEQFCLAKMLREQPLAHGKALSSISVIVSILHVAISYVELDEALSEDDLLAYVGLEQAQLFPRLGKDIYFDFVEVKNGDKQKVTIFAIDKDQLFFYLFKEDEQLNLDYLGIDKVVENASREVVGLESLMSIDDILIKEVEDNCSNDFLSQINAAENFLKFYKALNQLPEFFLPLLYLVVKQRWL